MGNMHIERMQDVAIVPLDILYDDEASGNLRMYIAMSWFQGNGSCFSAPYSELAERAGCSERQAIRGVKALIDSGWIIKERDVSDDGESLPNWYKVLFQKNKN